ncbi:MAG: hypothetical protein MUF79_11550 [Burkholderiales bacterium]|nr:hypothetical protein [Burkholderiales bacterium]
MISDTPGPPDLSGGDFDSLNPLRPDAVRVRGATRRGKPCELVDNTGERLPRAELESILAALVEQDAFGFNIASAKGGHTLDLERRESAHVQVGEKLYRLLVYRYEARIEPF